MERVRTIPLRRLSRRQANSIRAGQMEAARVWTLCRDLHLAARTSHQPWPDKSAFHQATRGGRFALYSQTVQQVFRAFDGAVAATREYRQQGRTEMRYPYKDKQFFPLMWPAQAMRLEAEHILLPMGRGRQALRFRRPDWLDQPRACKLVWNGVHNELQISVPVPETEIMTVPGRHATVDLGQIHQAAVVTNTGEALVISGRGLRTLKRQHSKQLGELARKRARCTRGSRRWKKLARARARLTLHSERRVRDLRHKGTRQVIDFCKRLGVESLFVGNPDGVRTRDCGRRHNQRMSQWEYGKDLDYLQQKAQQDRIVSFTGDERGTSSRCPVCGHRHKPRGRAWRCPACGFHGHRDVVGGVNMHPKAFGQVVTFPQRITYLRPGPLKAPRSSRPDTGQRCLAQSWTQAPQQAVSLRVPSGDRPQPTNLG